MRIATAWADVRTQEGCGGSMGNDPNTVSMRERVRVVKVDLDHPEKEPEIVEQETITQISLDTASLFGFVPGQGFVSDSDAHQPPVEGARVGDE